MQTVSDDFRRAGQEQGLANAVASCLGIRAGTWLENETSRYLHGGSRLQRGWFSFAVRLVLKRPRELTRSLALLLDRGPKPRTNPERFKEFLEVFRSDVALQEKVIRMRVEAETRGHKEFLLQRRCSLPAERNAPSDARTNAELRALDFLERYPGEIDAYFERWSSVSDLSVVLAVQIFVSWANEKLGAAALGFRLCPDRLTSSFRLVPRELHDALSRRSGCVDLRLVTPDTTMSAFFVAQITKPGIGPQPEKWIETVDLIDQLACAHLLSLFQQCPVCGRWMYVLHSRRTYCSNKCKYRRWTGTSQGKERRRKASAAYRKRFRQDTRKKGLRT